MKKIILICVFVLVGFSISAQKDCKTCKPFYERITQKISSGEIDPSKALSVDKVKWMIGKWKVVLEIPDPTNESQKFTYQGIINLDNDWLNIQLIQKPQTATTRLVY